jgi:hypothetical protein
MKLRSFDERSRTTREGDRTTSRVGNTGMRLEPQLGSRR